MSSKKKINKWILAILVLCAVSALGFVAFGSIFTKEAPAQINYTAIPLSKSNIQDTMSLSGTVYSGNTQNVYSNLNYTIKEIKVKLGDTVKAGDVLAILDTTDLEFEIKQSENNFLSAQASATEEERNLSSTIKDSQNSVLSSKLSLDKQEMNYNTLLEDYENNTSSKLTAEEKTLDNARQALEKAQTSLSEKTVDYENNKQLFDAGYISKSELDSFEKALKTANDDLDAAQRELNSATDSYNTTKNTLARELETAQKDLENARLNYQSALDSLARNSSKTLNNAYSLENQEISLNKLKKQLEDAVITAPIDGAITQLNAVVGSAPSGILFVIEDTEDLYASIKVKEYNLAKVQLGQQAIITTEATGNRPMMGQVSYVSPKSVSESETTTVEFEVHVKINEAAEQVKIGMNAFVAIIVNSRSNVFSVTPSMIGTKDTGEKIIYTLVDNVVREVVVTTGLETATAVEITGDLEDGIPVLTTTTGLNPGDVIEAQIMTPVIRQPSGERQEGRPAEGSFEGGTAPARGTGEGGPTRGTGAGGNNFGGDVTVQRVAPPQ